MVPILAAMEFLISPVASNFKYEMFISFLYSNFYNPSDFLGYSYYEIGKDL